MFFLSACGKYTDIVVTEFNRQTKVKYLTDMQDRSDAKEEIKRKISIMDLVGEYVVLKKKGGRFWGLCPFHSEKTASFTVSPEKEIFYCFGCQKHGDIFTFVMEIEKISFIEALKVLAQKANVTLTFDQDRETGSKKELLYDLYKRLAASFHHILLHNQKAEHARQYLAKRGVEQPVIDAFNLGYIPGGRTWLLEFLKKKNYSPEFIKESGLFTEKENQLIPYFYNRIIFPIKSANGSVIAYGGRSLADSGPKYLNSPETPIFRKGNNLFNLDLALKMVKETKTVYLVEGYMDVISLFRAGVENVVAPLGTALTENQVKLMKRYADKIVLFFDGDEAGERANLKAIEILMALDIESEVVEPYEGLDPDDILQKHGISGLKNLLKNTINSYKYLLKRAFFRYNKDTPKGKSEIFNFIFPYLKRTESQIKLEGYLTLLADSLKVDYDSVLKDFRNLNRVKVPVQPETQKEPLKKDVVSEELFLMLALSVHREAFEKVRCDLTLDDIEDIDAREIYIALEESFREGDISFEPFLAKIENKTLSALIAEKSTSDEYSYEPEKLIADGVLRLKRRLLYKKREEIIQLIKKYEKDEPWKMKDLLVEKMILDKEYEEIRKMKDV